MSARDFFLRRDVITEYEEPSGPGVRVDSGVRAGDEISGLYDPMIAKLIVHDTNRETARKRMLRALAEFRIGGPPTLLGFHAALLTEPCFVAGGTCHGRVESQELAQRADEMTELFAHRTTSVQRASDGAHTRERVVAVEVDGRSFDVRVHSTEPPWASLASTPARASGRRAWEPARVPSSARCRAPSSRSRSRTAIEVESGGVICVIEAMKMENEITAHHAGTCARSRSSRGQSVSNGQLICLLAGAE